MGTPSMDEAYYWLALRFVPGIGPWSYRKLIERFKTPKAVFEAGRDELKGVERLKEHSIDGILRFDRHREVEEELSKMERHGVTLLTIADELYPEGLRNIHDPPPFLYVKGKLAPQDRLAVAIVGARAASSYGRAVTRRLSRELSIAGLTIVSGMAVGIDTAAHRGALEVKGRTIAVLGSGLKVIYPPENRRLYHEIAERGAVVSEFSMDALPEAGHFPVRNRIISGMSLGVVVVEASFKSGSLITARLGLEQGREIFAVPGSVESMKSKGTHQLIKEGAKLAESASDILEEIAPMLRDSFDLSGEGDHAYSDLPEEWKAVIELMGEEPIHIDRLVKMSGWPASRVSSLLLQMELRGLVRQLPGKLFVKTQY